MKLAVPLALALVVALSACATPPADTQVAARAVAHDNDYVTGSRLPRKGAANSLGKMSEDDKQHLERELSRNVDAAGRKD